MESLSQSGLEALRLLVTGDRTLWEIVGVSFRVSLTAVLACAPLAVAFAALLAFRRFPGRQAVLAVLNTLLSLPAVVVGLSLYLVLSRHGPLGEWQLLFTQTAMVLGQMVLCFPLITAMCHAALQETDPRAWETARTLGAGPLRAVLTLLGEVRFALLGALIAGLGRVVAEVGSAMMLGGNILGYTRNITTAIALETSKGAFAQGIALGMVLLILAFSLNAGLHWLQGRSRLDPEYLT